MKHFINFAEGFHDDRVLFWGDVQRFRAGSENFQPGLFHGLAAPKVDAEAARYCTQITTGGAQIVQRAGIGEQADKGVLGQISSEGWAADSAIKPVLEPAMILVVQRFHWQRSCCRRHKAAPSLNDRMISGEHK